MQSMFVRNTQSQTVQLKISIGLCLLPSVRGATSGGLEDMTPRAVRVDYPTRPAGIGLPVPVAYPYITRYNRFSMWYGSCVCDVCLTSLLMLL